VIPTNEITAWAHTAPWPTPDQVEQDLLLSQLFCLIAGDDYLGDELVFRGGTCLHKLYLHPAQRYSEDLDYVRSTARGIGKVTRAITGATRLSVGAPSNTQQNRSPPRRPLHTWEPPAGAAARPSVPDPARAPYAHGCGASP